MNKAKAERLLIPAITDFNDFIGTQTEASAFVLTDDEAQSKRALLAEGVNAEKTPFSDRVPSETISGEDGNVILLYPQRVTSADKFNHAVYHECAHVYFRTCNPDLFEKAEKAGLSREARHGLTLFDEFIAEVLANSVRDDLPLEDAAVKQYELTDLLYEALPGINPAMSEEAEQQRHFAATFGIFVVPPVLGRYAAMILSDPTLIKLFEHNPAYERGLAGLTREETAIVGEILLELNDYTADRRANDVVFSMKEAEKLGRLSLKLWAVREKNTLKAVKK